MTIEMLDFQQDFHQSHLTISKLFKIFFIYSNSSEYSIEDMASDGISVLDELKD